MIASQASLSIVSSAIGTSLVAALSIPSATATKNRVLSRNREIRVETEKLYEDEDGRATEDSEKETSSFIPKLVGLTASALGSTASIAYAILATLPVGSSSRILFGWLTLFTWALLLSQSIAIFLERRHVRRFGLGLLAAASSLLLAINISLEHLPGIFRDTLAPTQIMTVVLIQIGLLFIAFVSFLLIQRRPDVFKDGRRVDGQFTASALGRLAFGWCASTLHYARRHKTLGLDDLPRLSAYQRSQVMEARFNAGDSGQRLWRSLFHMYWYPFLKQVAFITLVSVTQFGPQLAMFKLVRLLELGTGRDDTIIQAWIWAILLGAFMLVAALLESWLYFIIWSDMGMPIRALLSILVFSKATRRKDVKGAQRKKEETALAEQVIGAQQTKPSDQKGDDEGAQSLAKKDGPQEEEEEDDEDSVTKSRQATVNLVGVDAKRVSDFASFLYLYPGVVVKLAVSVAFLTNLIGWQSLLAGLAAFALTIPFNILLSKWYNNAQGKLMSIRDAKLATVNEALQGIRQIKFSAIEHQWQQKIAEKREAELRTQWAVFRYDTGLVSLWIFGPVMLAAICLCTYTMLHGELSASVAFTTIAVLSQIEMTLAIIPELTADALDAWVACQRIEKYLRAPEKMPTSKPGKVVRFENATVAWPADEQEEDSDRFCLKNVSIEFPPKQLSVISGQTGSGKSLLLAAILGEIDKLEGEIYVPKGPKAEDRFDHNANPSNWIIDSSIAFVAQQPWIENATIKDNILFGLPYDQGRYQKVLQACALVKDLDILDDGDMTDIGANGINLSGGQRWRVSFARAMYSRAGILVLDDIFSAVDAHVGRQLYEEALTGDLGVGRTRILVTHHVGLCLPKTIYSVHLAQGTVAHSGFVEELKKRGEMADILKEEADASRDDDLEIKPVTDVNGHLIAEASGDGTALTKVASRRSARSGKIDEGEVDVKGKASPKKFTEDEKREIGGIKLDVYWQYVLAGGGLLVWIPLVFAYLSASGLTMVRSYWVTLWTRSYSTESDSLSSAHFYAFSQISIGANSTYSITSPTSSSHSTQYWLGIYFGLSCLTWFFGTAKYYANFTASIKASRKLFDDINYSILRAPLRWLDTVPVGRILNRFSSDFNTIDSRVAGNMGFFFYQALEMIIITMAGFATSAYIVPFTLVLIGFAILVMKLYLGGAREVKRLESNARSPIFSDFGALLSGVATVRAFDKTATYIDRMYDKIDTHSSSFYHIWLFARWMGFRLSITGTAFAVAVAMIIVASDQIDAALAGFALNFALRYTVALNWTVRGYSNLEMDLNSAERIIEYSRIAIEDQSGNSPPAAWPTSGRLEVHDLVAGYAPDLPAVLKRLSFSVESGERVGVVGRTGAGKSSLTLALFRFIHQHEGQVIIDGLDVSQMKLHDLRSRLAIIPQDPVLFSGSVRSNLDPFDQHSESELKAALQRVHLTGESGSISPASIAKTSTTTIEQESDTAAATSTATASSDSSSGPPGESSAAAVTENKNVFSNLSSRISEGGLNLSQGQRQLLCLARAIVSRPRLMVLDEATSAVDMATDEMIQRSIREEFTGSTLLVIAHRLSTIADFDKILVMSEGKAVEFDTPQHLMALKNGVFRGMVENSGEHERLVQMIKAGSSA